VGSSQEIVNGEMKRVQSLRDEIPILNHKAQMAALPGFRDAEHAKAVLGGVTQREWNRYIRTSNFLFEAVGGGKP
jgi:hypothetical protein